MKKLVLSLLFSVCIVNSVFVKAAEVVMPQNKTLNTNNGRFVFGQISEFRKDQFMLDTKTGKLWNKVIKESGLYILKPVPYGFFYNDNYSQIPQ